MLRRSTRRSEPAARTDGVSTAGARVAAFRVAAALLLACIGCGESDSAPPRLVLLYAPCTVSKHFLSPWNDSIAFTPRLAEFASRSTVFERHQTEAGQSGISYASLFTGAQADRHGIFRHPARLADDLYLISEAYAESGYEVFYWNGHAMASDRLNYAQGVDPENVFHRGLTAEDPDFVRVLERLARDHDYKALVVTNFTVTHGPYDAGHVAAFTDAYPSEALGLSPEDVQHFTPIYRQNYLGLTWNHDATLERLGMREELPKLSNVIELLYRANIHHLDGLFGAVLDVLSSRDLLEPSLVVFTADHGEVLGRESATFKWTHSMLIDHEVIGVPLIVSSPWLRRARKRYEGVTRSIDVFPTMAGLSGIDLPADRGIQGVDLAGSLMDESPDSDLLAYSHTTVLVRSVFRAMYREEKARNWLEARRFFPDPDASHVWVAVRSGDDWLKHRKLEDGSWVTQRFDLAEDPGAERDVFDPSDARQATLRDQLLAYKAMLVRSYEGSRGAGAGELPLQRETELLRALGYVE